MAQFGPLNSPYIQGDTELVGAAPFGDLNTPYELDDPDGVDSTIANRFPTPPIVGAFLTAVDGSVGDIEGVSNPYVIAGALLPEGGYLEPTIGQIWPRIG